VIDLAGFHWAVRISHIIAAALGLAVFWIAIFAAKGGSTHVRCGRIFVWCEYYVGLTAIISCGWAIIDPISFGASVGWSIEQVVPLIPALRLFNCLLGLSALLVITYVQIGVRVLKTKDSPQSLANMILIGPLVVLGLASVGFTVFGMSHIPEAGLNSRYFVTMIIGLGCAQQAYANLQFARRPRPSPMAWWYKHMECMLFAGVAFHTAFAITLANRLTQYDVLNGPLAVVPWVLPSIIGVPAVWLWIRSYKDKFGELSTARIYPATRPSR
jgi:hypothetical protein